MDRRVAQGLSGGPGSGLETGAGPAELRWRSTRSRLASVGIGLLLVAVALVVYSHTKPYRFYDHFEWQAEAFLEGQNA